MMPFIGVLVPIYPKAHGFTVGCIREVSFYFSGVIKNCPCKWPTRFVLGTGRFLTVPVPIYPVRHVRFVLSVRVFSLGKPRSVETRGRAIFDYLLLWGTETVAVLTVRLPEASQA